MKEIVVDKNNSSKKLFRFIKSILPGLTNTEIFKLLRKEVIKVNNKKENPDYILKTDDKVNFYLSDIHFEKKGKKLNLDYINSNSNLDIIFEDNDLLVVNKPSGIPVHAGKIDSKNVLTEIVKSYLYKKKEFNNDNFFTPTPCHRIDTNTSGIVVFAKNHLTLKNITTQFRERKVEKLYLCLTFGIITNKLFITSNIETDKNKENKVIIKNFKKSEIIPEKNCFINQNKNLSSTLINPINQANNITMCEVELWTGKKHQIRSHLKECGYPLVGDKKYFTNESGLFSKFHNVDTYLLHAYKIKIDGYDEWIAQIPKKFKKTVFDLMKINI